MRTAFVVFIHKEQNWTSGTNSLNGKCIKYIYLFVGLRLLNIGRNEYIELMNQARSNRGRLFGRKKVRGLLPKVPCDIHIEPWWRVEVGLVLEEDVKVSYIHI